MLEMTCAKSKGLKRSGRAASGFMVVDELSAMRGAAVSGETRRMGSWETLEARELGC